MLAKTGKFNRYGSGKHTGQDAQEDGPCYATRLPDVRKTPPIDGSAEKVLLSHLAQDGRIFIWKMDRVSHEQMDITGSNTPANGVPRPDGSGNAYAAGAGCGGG